MNQVTLLDGKGSPIDPATIEAIRRVQSGQPQTSRVAVPAVTAAGIAVNADNALKLSACWACARYLSQSVAVTPWNLRLETPRGSAVQKSHPVHWMLRDRASEEWSSFQFRETMTHWALRHGNGYAEIERYDNGRPAALWPIHPSRTRVMRDLRTGRIAYQVSGNSTGPVYLEPEDVFHLRGFGEGPVGLSLMDYAAQSLGWAAAVQLFGAGFFKRSANPSGIVTAKRKLTPEGLRELRSDFAKLYQGAGTQNQVVFLDGEMEYKPISSDPESSQFVETNQFLLDEICRWFGVPPHKIYNLLRSTFVNIEHQSIEAVYDSILPWAKRFQDEADLKLLGQNRTGYYTQMDLQELVRRDSASRMQFFQGLRNIGALNVNEIRGEEGYNDIGPAGDKYTLQSGMTTLDKIGADPDPPPPQQSPQLPPPSARLVDRIREYDRLCA